MRIRNVIFPALILLLQLKTSAPAMDWPRAEDEPRATPESLAEKARFYDDIAARLHVHPDLKWIMSVTLPCGGEDCSEPAVTQEQATWRDVQRWHSGENDGLWNALYMGALGYRYAVTKDPAALDMIRRLLEGEEIRMRITGVPGVFTRQFIPPGVDGISCPENIESYIPDREKDDNRWVMVRDDGCVWTVDPDTREWTQSNHCGLDEFANWCWLDNVSKDEYSGNMFGLGVLARTVDDPDVQRSVRDMLSQIAHHLMDNGNEFVDWDGRTCEHGRLRALTFGDYPGFNAAMSLSYFKTAAVVTGDPKIAKWYDDCLLQKSGRKNCMNKAWETPAKYTKYLSKAGMFPGKEGCRANFNNISMHLLSLHNLIWYETDPDLLRIYRRHLDREVARAPGQPRATNLQNNAFFDFIWAANMEHTPELENDLVSVVDNAVRMLRQFPARKNTRTVECPPDKCREYCLDRFDRPTGDYARPVADRCLGKFIWWRDPYSLGSCTEDRRTIHAPIDYLLAYWMGRYYGFISEDM